MSDSIPLQPPGAGLPFMEHFVAKHIIMPIRHRTLNWEMADRYFAHETAIIQQLCQPLAPEQLLQPVLIRRLQGLEDSSRNWSVAMVLEHLMITGKGMADIVIQLSRGHEPGLSLSTASVKPKGILGADALDQFLQTMRYVEKRLSQEIENRNSLARQSHPWFGPMNAHQWHNFLGIHQNIHRKQIQEILKTGVK